MLCWFSPPKCRAFVIICCYMLNQHNTATTSLKGLVRCKTAVKALIDETLSLSVAFDVFRTAADETGVPVDPQALEECRQMLITMNRLMYRQLSDLKHRQMLQIASRVAEREMNAIRPAGFRKAANE